jgi:hypothetical protein
MTGLVPAENETHHVMAGLVPAISTRGGAAGQSIGITGTSPVMTRERMMTRERIMSVIIDRSASRML